MSSAVSINSSAVDQGGDYQSPPPPPPWLDVLRLCLLSVSAFFVISGNIFCIGVVSKSPQIRKASRIFIISLMTADFCTGLFSGCALLVGTAIGHRLPDLPVGEILCKVYFVSGIMFNGTSFMSLLTVITDCYIAIEKPLRYPSLLTARRAYNTTVTVWLGMLIGTTGYAVYFGMLPHYKQEWHWCLVETAPFHEGSYIMLLFLYTGLTVVLPAMVTIGLHARIHMIVHRHAARLARITPPGHPCQQRRTTDTKSMRTFLIVNCGVALTSLPFCIVLLYSYWSNDFSMYIISAVMVLRSYNNLLNVLVHIRRNKEFRSTASRIVPCMLKHSQSKPKACQKNSFQLSVIAQ